MSVAMGSDDKSDVAAVAGITTVSSGVHVLAMIIQESARTVASRFFTHPESEFQVGFIVHSAGHEVPPHRHVPMMRKVHRTCEVLVVRRGCCEVEIFDEEGTSRLRATLHPHDVAVFLSGGHAVRMLEDCTLLEVKQGPYLGDAEKELI